MYHLIIFAVATGLFALAMVFNMNVLQSNSAGDVSLESIAVMAQAQEEYSGTITCGRWGGQCWVYEGSWSGEYWTDCRFSGYMADFCWS